MGEARFKNGDVEHHSLVSSGPRVGLADLFDLFHG